MEAYKGHMYFSSLENEKEAWNYITLVIDATLALFPTTLDQDLKLLDKIDLKLKQDGCDMLG